MDYIDITLPLSEMTPAFPGDPEVRFEPIVRDGYRLTLIELSSHSGTHIDAPLHYIEGSRSVDMIPLGRINGESIIVDMKDVRHPSGFIMKGDIPEKTGVAGILILKTGFSPESSGMDHYMSINSECAEYLADCGYTCVVTDAPSIEAFDGDGTVHRTLLGRDVYIIEMADLSNVSPGRYRLYAMPLKLEGCDGSPVRAVLVPCSKEV
jgi:arylformamidase